MPAFLAFAYLCFRNVRFTYAPLNYVFFTAFLIIPWFAARPLLRLRSWPKVVGLMLLTPLLALSVLLLLFHVAWQDFGRHPERVRDLGSIRQGHCSVHLIMDSSGGALGPHGLSLEQRLPILPGLYLFKYLAWFDGAYEGTLSAVEPDKVRVQVTKSMNRERQDRTYALKPWLYF